MLARILLENETWYVTIGWFGLGRMEVTHFPTGSNAIAPSWLKSHFINAMHALSKNGIPISPDSEIAVLAMETYAEFILDPSALVTRASLSQTPSQLADAIIQMARQ